MVQIAPFIVPRPHRRPASAFERRPGASTVPNNTIKRQEEELPHDDYDVRFLMFNFNGGYFNDATPPSETDVDLPGHIIKLLGVNKDAPPIMQRNSGKVGLFIMNLIKDAFLKFVYCPFKSLTDGERSLDEAFLHKALKFMDYRMMNLNVKERRESLVMFMIDIVYIFYKECFDKAGRKTSLTDTRTNHRHNDNLSNIPILADNRAHANILEVVQAVASKCSEDTLCENCGFYKKFTTDGEDFKTVNTLVSNSTLPKNDIEVWTTEELPQESEVDSDHFGKLKRLWSNKEEWKSHNQLLDVRDIISLVHVYVVLVNQAASRLKAMREVNGKLELAGDTVSKEYVVDYHKKLQKCINSAITVSNPYSRHALDLMCMCTFMDELLATPIQNVRFLVKPDEDQIYLNAYSSEFFAFDRCTRFIISNTNKTSRPPRMFAVFNEFYTENEIKFLDIVDKEKKKEYDSNGTGQDIIKTSEVNRFPVDSVFPAQLLITLEGNHVVSYPSPNYEYGYNKEINKFQFSMVTYEPEIENVQRQTTKFTESFDMRSDWDSQIQRMSANLLVSTAVVEGKGLDIMSFGGSGVGKTSVLFGVSKNGGLPPKSGLLSKILSSVPSSVPYQKQEGSNIILKIRIYETAFIGGNITFFKMTKEKQLIGMGNDDKQLTSIDSVLTVGEYKRFPDTNTKLRELDTILQGLRSDAQRIRPTQNNPESSRSIVTYSFQITYTGIKPELSLSNNELSVFINLMDLPGTEHIDARETTFINGAVKDAMHSLDSSNDTFQDKYMLAPPEQKTKSERAGFLVFNNLGVNKNKVAAYNNIPWKKFRIDFVDRYFTNGVIPKKEWVGFTAVLPTKTANHYVTIHDDNKFTPDLSNDPKQKYITKDNISEFYDRNVIFEYLKTIRWIKNEILQKYRQYQLDQTVLLEEYNNTIASQIQ